MSRTNLTYLGMAVNEVARLTILEECKNWNTPRAVGHHFQPANLPERGERGSPRIKARKEQHADVADVLRDTINQRRKR